FQNGYLVIKHLNRSGLVYNIGNQIVHNSYPFNHFYVDEEKNIWATSISEDRVSQDLLKNDTILEHGKRIPNYHFDEENWFIYFYEREKEPPLYYFINGQKK